MPEEIQYFFLTEGQVMLKGLTPDGIKYLMEHQMIQGIEYCSATPDQLEAMYQGLKRNTSIRKLHIPPTLCPVNKSTLSPLLTVNNSLQDLELRRNLNDHSIELLSASLSINRSLHELTLNDCTDTGAQHLATMLTANTTLQKLNLFSSSITDTGILHISEALKHNNSLTSLGFGCNYLITNTGAVALSKMLLVNKSLRTLDLYSVTAVREEGAAALLESLLHNQVLTQLRLPLHLNTYCEQHVFYPRVKNKVLMHVHV